MDLEAYLRARNRGQLHQFLLRAFVDSGMTRAELAKRTGKKPEVISRILGRPSNLTADTVAEVLFALNGMAPKYAAQDLFAGARAGRNHTHRPEWADGPIEARHQTAEEKASKYIPPAPTESAASSNSVFLKLNTEPA